METSVRRAVAKEHLSIMVSQVSTYHFTFSQHGPFGFRRGTPACRSEDSKFCFVLTTSTKWPESDLFSPTSEWPCALF